MAAYKKIKSLFLALSLFAVPAAAGDLPNGGGRVVIIGGGGNDDVVTARLVELAGGKNARIVIIPQASGDPAGAAKDQAEQFLRLGAGSVDWVLFPKGGADKPEILEKFRKANLVYMTGGDQVTLFSFVGGTKLLEEMRRIHREGGIVAGTSAGAAIMSRVMLTGDDRLAGKDEESFSAIRSSAVVTAEGFGFVPENIVMDQHFLARKRQNRLISVLLEHPGLNAGIGIDENTALIVSPDGSCEAAGISLVSVFEKAKGEKVSEDGRGHLAARGITLHLLKAGDKYTLPKP
ncbi:MAG: cyanophycinase [Elusimicrobia bacterium GWC2_63_65]|nr:MAG: cyanophycinase [Elusimicrobia bacterium GWC2_63_65]